MLNELEEVKHYEKLRHQYQRQMLSAKLLRDLWIVNAFEVGNRQKDIGQACGLSESTIKHIIAKQGKDRS